MTNDWRVGKRANVNSLSGNDTVLVRCMENGKPTLSAISREQQKEPFADIGDDQAYHAPTPRRRHETEDGFKTRP